MNRHDETDAFKLRVLKGAALFDAAGEGDLAELVRVGRMAAFDRGKPLSRPDGPNIYVIQSGVAAELLLPPGQDEPVLVALAGRGEIAGLAGALASPARKAAGRSVEALTEVAAFTAPAAGFLRVCRRNAELSIALAGLVAKQEQDLAGRLAKSLHDPLEMRVAALFMEIADRLASDDWSPVVHLGRLPQSSIAAMLGVSREHVNRTITMWERLGLIFKDKRGDISIQNMKRLRSIASVRAESPIGGPKDEWLAEIDLHLDRGLNQSALDLATEASRRAPRQSEYGHRAVLATARLGAISEALALLDKHKLGRDGADEDLACLRPRLQRDLAFDRSASAPDRDHLSESAAEYERVFQASSGFYSGVNAAAGYALGGDGEKSRAIARRVAALIAAEGETAEADDYWRRTTLAECKLLEGDIVAASALFEAASAAPNATPGKKATTRKQLRRLAPFVGVDEGWIDRVAPQPRVMFFSGPLAREQEGARPTADLLEALKDALIRHEVGWAYGALASGADIIIAEALIAAGVDLSVFLPLAPADFLKSSVGNGDWRERFVACIRDAASVEWSRRTFEPCDAAYRLGAEIAMGKAIRRARELETEPFGFFAAPAGEAESHSAANLSTWRRRRLPFVEAAHAWPDATRPRRRGGESVLFAVVVEGAHSERPSGSDFRFRVEDDVDIFLWSALEGAMDYGRRLAAESGSWRCWLDVGVFPPAALEGRADQAASRLVTAASMPLTEEGRVYASEAFACSAALAAPEAASFEYVGYSATREKLDPCALYLARFRSC
jgi:CRP-like cAMP-binding protein